MLAGLDRLLAPLTWLAALFTLVVLLAGPELIGAKADAPVPAPAYGQETPTPDGAALFAASCGGCHALAAAGTSGGIGPDLDSLAPSAETVAAVVASGNGSMPAFAGELTPEEIDAIAAYVAESAAG